MATVAVSVHVENDGVGDDFAGTNCGFDSAGGWRIVEIDPTNFSKDVVGEDFAAFIRIRIAAAA